MITFRKLKDNPDRFYKISQVAQFLRTSNLSVRRWCLDKKIESSRLNGHFIIRGSSLISYLEGLNGFKSMAEILKTYKLPYERK